MGLRVSSPPGSNCCNLSVGESSDSTQVAASQLRESSTSNRLDLTSTHSDMYHRYISRGRGEGQKSESVLDWEEPGGSTAKGVSLRN